VATLAILSVNFRATKTAEYQEAEALTVEIAKASITVSVGFSDYFQLFTLEQF